jgi:hypothetical protein
MLYSFYFTNQLVQSQFTSENFFFQIEWKKKFPKVNLILHSFGPFGILEKSIVPFLYSTVLEKMKISKLLNPRWLNQKWLEKKIFMEIDQENLQMIPRNYIELSYMVCKNNKKVLDYIAIPIILVEEIFSIRISKLKMVLKLLKIPIRAFKLKNIGEVELFNYKKILQIQLQINNFIHL